ncbi:MAG: Coq4 family protein, partial [Pseudomonadota bacterium]|nr:Coq4 family protein [Pseudomonadota bacterium]
SLHEMAISAFQLAQFGHNYSAMFLTTVCSMSHLKQPMGFPLLLQNLAEAWVHGCEMPDFVAIEWEQDWHLKIEDVRAKHGIEPFSGAFPADLLEQLSQAS